MLTIGSMSLKFRWCGTVALNANATSTTKSNYVQLEYLFAQLSAYQINTICRYQCKSTKIRCFKTGNETLHENGNNNSVRMVNFAMYKT
jgi:hypothetical protein